MMQKPLNPDISGFKVLVASYESTWEVIQVIKIELKWDLIKYANYHATCYHFKPTDVLLAMECWQSELLKDS